MEWGRIQVVLWAIWTHRNKQVMKGKAALTEGSFKK